MGTLFTDEEEKFILDNWETKSNKELAVIIGRGITDGQIRRWLQHMGIYRRGKNKNTSCRFSDEDIEYMKDNYVTMEYKEIADHLGYTERQIRGKINNMGLTKTRKINSHYFDTIDDSDKAYLLGYIFADGWIVYNEDQRNYEFGMELQSGDGYILKILNDKLGGLNIITHTEPCQAVICGKTVNKGPMDCLRVYSKDLVLGLISNGIVTNKSLKSDHPCVDDKYFFDFLRGYIDGDGWYWDMKSHTYMGIVCGNIKPLQYIQNKLTDFNIETRLYKENDRKYKLICCKISEMEKLIPLLYYSDDIIYLSRKYEKIKHYLGPSIQ